MGEKRSKGRPAVIVEQGTAPSHVIGPGSQLIITRRRPGAGQLAVVYLEGPGPLAATLDGHLFRSRRIPVVPWLPLAARQDAASWPAQFRGTGSDQQ